MFHNIPPLSSSFNQSHIIKNNNHLSSISIAKISPTTPLDNREKALWEVRVKLKREYTKNDINVIIINKKIHAMLKEPITSNQPSEKNKKSVRFDESLNKVFTYDK